jgi:hypothetical protein
MKYSGATIRRSNRSSFDMQQLAAQHSNRPIVLVILTVPTVINVGQGSMVWVKAGAISAANISFPIDKLCPPDQTAGSRMYMQGTVIQSWGTAAAKTAQKAAKEAGKSPAEITAAGKGAGKGLFKVKFAAWRDPGVRRADTRPPSGARSLRFACILTRLSSVRYADITYVINRIGSF